MYWMRLTKVPYIYPLSLYLYKILSVFIKIASQIRKTTDVSKRISSYIDHVLLDCKLYVRTYVALSHKRKNKRKNKENQKIKRHNTNHLFVGSYNFME